MNVSRLVKCLTILVILSLFNTYGVTSLENNSLIFQNFTANINETIQLKCPFSPLKDNQVTWIKQKDGHILTSGFIKYTNDLRVSPHFQNSNWILQIRNINQNDSGIYKCGIIGSKNDNSSEDISYFLFLTINDPIKDNKNEMNFLNFLDMSNEIQTEKLKEIMSKAEHIIRRAEDSAGNLNPGVIVNEFLTDPIPVKDFNISDEGDLSSFEGSLKNMKLHGLKQMKISKLLFNLGLIQLKVIMELPVLSLQGVYEMDGKVTFFPFYGDGDFYMNVTEIEINAFGSLEKSSGGTVKVSDIKLEVYTDNIDLHMDNLMGGGLMGGISNSLINQMSGMIFQHIKNTLLDEVSYDIKNMINIQLSHLPLDFLKEDSSSVFDALLDRVKHTINESNLEPMVLPPFKDHFNYNVMVFKLNGELNIFKGYLKGLSTLVRTGDIVATYHNNEVIFEARMGFSNLTGGYDFSTNVMGGGPSGSTSISISDISCYLRLKQSLKKGEKPKISSFKVERINHLWVDVNGLGSWDFILEIIINLVSNAFKLSLANAISGPITQAVQKELNNFPITFL